MPTNQTVRLSGVEHAIIVVPFQDQYMAYLDHSPTNVRPRFHGLGPTPEMAAKELQAVYDQVLVYLRTFNLDSPSLDGYLAGDHFENYW